MRFTGITELKVENGLITEEIGLDDGLTALRQLGPGALAPPRSIPGTPHENGSQDVFRS
jgi:hypothetical protein